jgi:hypothetical protein
MKAFWPPPRKIYGDIAISPIKRNNLAERSSMKSTLVRLTPKLYKQLKVRSLVQRRPMSDIVREALELHFKVRPITQNKFRAYLKEILAEDKKILDALRDL